MRRFLFIFILIISMCINISEITAEEHSSGVEYTVGVDDVIEINVLQPDKLQSIVTVSPDGFISFPYLGSIQVKDLTLSEIQNQIKTKLADGYMKYPVVSVILKESRSRKFFIYGEVVRPGAYPVDNNMTVLRAISMAGGFSKYGSSSRVKVLRPNQDQPGYASIKVNMKKVMGGTEEDILILTGDIVVVSEGVF